MAIVDYANFITECLNSDGFPIRADGWLLKHIDTGDAYIHVAGSWQHLSLGMSFAPPTKSGSAVTDANGIAVIVFETPFIDNAYTVALTCDDYGVNPVISLVTNKLSTGFNIQTRSTRSGQPIGSVNVSWLATRNHNL